MTLARAENSIRMTAMIGTGLMATPTAKVSTSPIPWPMAISFVRRSVDREPGADLGFVIDVALTGDVDDDFVDGAAGEREGPAVGVVGCDR